MTEVPRETERILKGLTKAQSEAVTHEAGPLLIIAGAGTGKTTPTRPQPRWKSAWTSSCPTATRMCRS